MLDTPLLQPVLGLECLGGGGGGNWSDTCNSSINSSNTSATALKATMKINIVLPLQNNIICNTNLNLKEDNHHYQLLGTKVCVYIL